MESSSAESFVSNKSEDPGVEDHPPRGSLSGLVLQRLGFLDMGLD